MKDNFFSNINRIMHPIVSLHVITNKETVVDFYEENIRKAIRTCDIPKLLCISIDSPFAMIEPRTMAHGFINSNSRETILYHTPPQVRTIHIEQPQARSFDFRFPDLLFLVTRDLSDHTFDSSVSLFTFDQTPETLYVPPLYNIHSNGSLCLGSVDTDNCKTVREFLDTAVFNSIWTHANYVPPRISKKGTLGDYLYAHREMGWNFEDLPIWGDIQRILKEFDHD